MKTKITDIINEYLDEYIEEDQEVVYQLIKLFNEQRFPCSPGNLNWEVCGSIHTAKKGKLTFEIIHHFDEDYPFYLGVWYGETYPEAQLIDKFFSDLIEAKKYCHKWFEDFRNELLK